MKSFFHITIIFFTSFTSFIAFLSLLGGGATQLQASSFKALPPEKRYQNNLAENKLAPKQKQQTITKKHAVPASVTTSASRATSAELAALKNIESSNRQIEQLLKSRNSAPLIIDSSFSFATGDVLRGILLNSIVSTNLDSPVLVEVKNEEQGLPAGSKFSCHGVTKHRRVVTACDLLIIDKDEYPVETIVLNTDGTAGLKGIYYSGQEEYIAAAVASEFAKGVLDVSQQKVMGPFGTTYTENTMKNKLLQGSINSVSKTTDLIEEEMRSKEPKVYIDAGQEVLVYFTKRFSTQTAEEK